MNETHKHKVALITNIPVPYREATHEIVDGYFSYTVIYCAALEPNRYWKTETGNYNKLFLSKQSKGFVHNKPQIWRELNRLNPEVIITTGFNPTMLYSFLWSMLHRKKHISFTDGTKQSEKHLSVLHRLSRKLVYSATSAFIGPSKGSTDLYLSYNIPEDKIFKSHLCINNELFSSQPFEKKAFDIMFSGQLIQGKLPLFFVEVAKRIKEKLGYCKVLILGAGNLKEETLAKLREYDIEFEYPGFVEQNLLPHYYSQARVFLFPTENDTWGIVANEAMASGVPVITCENAGVAHDLVIHNQNGYILPLDVDIWSESVIELLQNKPLYGEFSRNARTHSQKYNFHDAALGIITAVKSVLP